MRTQKGKGYWLGVTVCAWAVTLLAGAPVRAEEGAGSAEKWQIEITPYFWAAGLNGTTGVAGVTGNVDMSVGDILDRLDSTFMGMVEARKGPWSVLFDGGYMRLKGEATKSWSGPGGIGTSTGQLSADATDEVLSLAVGHRVGGQDSRADVLLGVRYTKIDSNLDLVVSTAGTLPGGTRRVSDDQGWWDPIVGFRIIVPFAERWSAVGYADVGGFGIGSVLSSQSLIGVNWELTKNIIAKAGFRYLIQDYTNDEFVWNMTTSGPYLGVGIRF